MGIKTPKIPDPPAPAPPPPPPPSPAQLSSSAVLGSVENTQIAAARAAGRGMGSTILTGPEGLFDITKTPRTKQAIVGGTL